MQGAQPWKKNLEKNQNEKKKIAVIIKGTEKNVGGQVMMELSHLIRRPNVFFLYYDLDNILLISCIRRYKSIHVYFF